MNLIVIGVMLRCEADFTISLLRFLLHFVNPLTYPQRLAYIPRIRSQWNTDEYTTVFSHSGWLYFLWHGIKCNINPLLFSPCYMQVVVLDSGLRRCLFLSFRYRNPSRPTSLEDKSADLQRHSSWGPRPKLNGDINKNGMQVCVCWTVI